MTTQAQATTVQRLTACDGCGEHVDGISPEMAGLAGLLLCAQCNHGTAVAGGGSLVEGWSSEPFVPSQFCTPHCGRSRFADWLHTPLCEKRYAEALDAELNADPTCWWCGWDETSSDVHAEDCGR